MFFAIIIGSGLVCYGLVRVAEAIKDVVHEGVIVYHQPRGRTVFEYEQANDDRNWKITAFPRY